MNGRIETAWKDMAQRAALVAGAPEPERYVHRTAKVTHSMTFDAAPHGGGPPVVREQVDELVRTSDGRRGCARRLTVYDAKTWTIRWSDEALMEAYAWE